MTRRPRRTAGSAADRIPTFRRTLVRFNEFGAPTERSRTNIETGNFPLRLPTYCNEFWTAKMRGAHSLHEVPYRACFKPQLPRFFIQRLTRKGELVYDPFMGRGTTLLEAALLGRRVAGCDINPLGRLILEPRLTPPKESEVAARLGQIDLWRPTEIDQELLTFYHPRTLQQLTALRRYLLEREAAGTLDPLDQWVRMVAVNRLTGHSSGFFSVYTLPPNQEVTLASQRRINRNRAQTPPERDIARLILKKSRSLLRSLRPADRLRLRAAAADVQLVTGSADQTPQLADESISLIVTSPPFLNVVDYVGNNRLRCWFTGIDGGGKGVAMERALADWHDSMIRVLKELRRLLRPGGVIACEVGEIRKGAVKLEESIVTAALDADLEPVLLVVNRQSFSKTSNCWGIANRQMGTNTNRIVLLRKGG